MIRNILFSRAALIGAIAALVACCWVKAADAAERTATPASLASVFASSAPGDTILLASGSYTFAGGMKAAPAVTLRPQPGAVPNMSLSFNPAQNIVITGVTIRGATLADSRTRNITVSNSDITGQVTFRTGELANSNVLFDRNVHRDWDKCSNCAEGRIWLPENTGQPSGITISNSEFRGGLSDGIQNGSNGTRIIGNNFHDLTPGSASGVHADAIQLYGSRNTLIRGNWFHHLGSGVGIIMGADGVDHEIIEDNVVGPAVSRPFLDISSDDSSIIRHNTLADGACEFNQRCGGIVLANKTGDPVGQGTVIENNILRSISGSGSFTSRYNLLAGQNPIGTGDIRGLPTYVGPLTSYQGFALAAGSLGKGNASDGLDRGARIAGAPDPEPTPTPTPSPTPDPTPEPTPTPSPTPTPTPDPGYHPACEPTCDQQIASLQGQLADALNARDQAILERNQALGRMDTLTAAIEQAIEILTTVRAQTVTATARVQTLKRKNRQLRRKIVALR